MDNSTPEATSSRKQLKNVPDISAFPKEFVEQCKPVPPKKKYTWIIVLCICFLATGYVLGDYFGYVRGEDAGWDTGFDSGEQVGYSRGFTKGRESGKSTGYSTGYSDGYDEGYAAAQPKQQREVSYRGQVTTRSVDYTVYITETGSKYHRWGCQYLRESCYYISLSDAIARGYTACSVCSP